MNKKREEETKICIVKNYEENKKNTITSKFIYKELF